MVDAELRRPPDYGTSFGVLAGGGGLALLGTVFVLMSAGGTHPDDATFSGIGVGLAAAGGVAAAVGIALLAAPLRENWPRLELTLAEDQAARVDLGPGVLHVETATSDVVLTPFGAAGTF